MQTIDPVIFVDFKRWVASEAPERPALKRRRDANQAAIVEALLNEGLLMF